MSECRTIKEPLQFGDIVILNVINNKADYPVGCRILMMMVMAMTTIIPHLLREEPQHSDVMRQNPKYKVLVSVAKPFWQSPNVALSVRPDEYPVVPVSTDGMWWRTSRMLRMK